MQGILAVADNRGMFWMTLILLALIVLGFAAATTRVKGQFSVTFKVVKGLAEFTQELGTMATEFLQTNWSGQPEDFQRALKALLEKARALAVERGVVIDEDTIRTVLIQVIARPKVVKRAQLVAAMDSIERPTPRAA